MCIPLPACVGFVTFVCECVLKSRGGGRAGGAGRRAGSGALGRCDTDNPALEALIREGTVHGGYGWLCGYDSGLQKASCVANSLPREVLPRRHATSRSFR